MNAAWLLILVMVALGKLLRHSGGFPGNAPATLNRYVIDIALPALVLTTVPGLVFRADLLWLVLTPWLLLVLSAGVVLLAGRALGWRREVVGVLLLCVPLGNTAFLGYPITQATLGAEAVPLAVIYDQFGSFLILSSYGLLIAAIYGGSERPGVVAMLRRIVLFPPFIALMIALLPIAWPEMLMTVAGAIAATLVPTACLAVGLQLRFRMDRSAIAPFASGTVLKLLIMPLAAWLLLQGVGAAPELVRVGVLESAMPSMITAGALASAAGLDPDLAAALVGYGIIIAFLTVPLLMWWVG